MASVDRTDLRHMTSAAHLPQQRSPHRPAQLVRLGSRSPASIPSSPTSVRSSSSAIFERDIEPLVCPSSTSHAHHNPHRIPRAKGTEHLEHSVPSVLDSAASVLATLEDSADVAVVAPALLTSATTSPGFPASSGFASPIGSFRSRSPSPLGLRVASGHGGPIGRTELLLSIPTNNTSTIPSPRSTPAAMSVAPPFFSSSSPPNPAVSPLLPSIAPPPSGLPDNGSGAAAASEHESVGAVTSSSTLPSHPTTSNNPLPTTTPSHRPSHSSPTSITTTTTSPMVLSSHPPSPTAATMNVPTKRLSFMSYSDLLTSTPSSLVSLSSLTSAASSMEPPPHIPCVNGYAPSVGIFGPSASSPISYSSNQKGPTSNSATTSLRGFVTGNNNHGAGKKESGIPMVDDNLGGEWEREGLGRGLEERLEALIRSSSAAGSPMVSVSREQQQRSTSFGSAQYPVMIGARI